VNEPGSPVIDTAPASGAVVFALIPSSSGRGAAASAVIGPVTLATAWNPLELGQRRSMRYHRSGGGRWTLARRKNPMSSD